MSGQILPPATLGMLGGGQLGRFFVQAAQEIGYRVVVLDPDRHSPAGRLADEHLQAAYDDQDALRYLSESCVAVTTEFENVPAASLEYLAKFMPVRPSAHAVEVAQNRAAEKAFLAENGFPVAPFAVLLNEEDLAAVDAALFPAILKVSRFGYDGKGQVSVDSPATLRAAWHALHNEPCVLEKRLPLDCELSVVLARAADGDEAVYPVAENRHRRGILDVSIVPAQVASGLADAARDMAGRVADALGYEGVMAVEFFVTDGRLCVNEIAPRPHNSGHYTLDACDSSQYEQQVRALCGLPLSSARMHSPSVMVNLLGELWYDADHYREPDWSCLLGEPGLRLHSYGKHHARPGRKMAHFTVLGEKTADALERALAARAAIGSHDD